MPDLVPHHPYADHLTPVEADGHLCPLCGGIPRRESKTVLGLTVLEHCPLCQSRGMVTTEQLARYQAELLRQAEVEPIERPE